MSGEIGQIIEGKYRLTRLLGSGGMGAVYEGENLRIHRRVAIKMLHSQVSSQAETVTRFEREAQAAGRIGSEHICEVLDLGVMPDGTRYMVMEYLEGETLGARIKRFGRLTPRDAVPLVTQVLDALEAAHAVGIVHRDLKPDNVWIMPSRGGTKDFVKILDFGVSKFSQAAGGDEMNATRAGSVVGTPYYMSPEQARGMGSIDGRTDVYAIGVVLYQAVTGQVPYQAETFNELLFKIVLEVAPPPQTYVPDLDVEFSGIIVKAMEREPGQRYQTCGEFKAALLAFQARAPGAAAHPPPAQRPRSGLAAGGTAFLDHSPMPLPAAPRPDGPPLPPAQAQAPWGHASSSGGGPPVGMIGVGPAGLQLGSNTPPTAAWGNASGTGAGAAPPTKSKAGMAIGICAAIVAVCGIATAAIFLRTPAAASGSSAPASAAAAADAPSAVPSPAPPTATAEAASSASAAPSANAPEVASAPESASAPATAEVREAEHPTNKRTFAPRPAPPKPTATSKPAPAKPPAGDLGY